jgi:Uncharacterised nucleotidyltransferase
MQSTPEFRLFCLALRKPQHAADVDALRLALTSPDRNALNWAALIEGARRHRVADLFLEGLQAAGVADASEDLLAALRRRNHAAKRLIIARGFLVAKLARMFSLAGIRALMLKGLALSMQLYGDPARREPGDIDLLIDPAQFDEAKKLLVDAGLRPKGGQLSSRQRAVHHDFIKDETFVHAGTDTSVELHHRLTDNPELLSTDFDALWRAREEISIWGTPVATLSRADLLLYLCAHGGAHAWERLRWLVDLADAVRNIGDEAAIALARAAGLGPTLLHAMMLAHDWLGLPVEPRLLAEANEDPVVAQLDRVFARLYEGEAWHRIPRRSFPAALQRDRYWQLRYRLALKLDRGYRVRQIMRELTSPADWRTVALPDRLFFLYPLVRPIGWLFRRNRS